LDERLATDAAATTPVDYDSKSPRHNPVRAVPELDQIAVRRRVPAFPKPPRHIAPDPKLTRAARSRNSPETIVSAGEVSLQVGDEETTPSPSAAPNAISTRETAEATSAPAKTGVHWRKEVAVPTATISVRSEIVTLLSFPKATFSGGRGTTK